MQKNKLIFEGQEYELYKSAYPEFIISLREPYPFIGTKIGDSDFGFKDYKYKSLVINGEYYSFKLIEKTNYSNAWEEPINAWAALIHQKDPDKLLKLETKKDGNGKR